MTQPTNGAHAPHKSYGAHLVEVMEYIAAGLEQLSDGELDWNDVKNPPDGWCMLHLRALVMYLAVGYDSQGFNATHLREWAPHAAQLLDGTLTP